MTNACGGASRQSGATLARRTLFILMCVVAGVRAGAQVVPNDRWMTLETPHFRVHFTPPLEEIARRTAPAAERAFALLSRELVPPRGKVDIVVADNVDYTNGYATPLPSNRIVIFAHPPVDQVALRNYVDWNELVVTHELLHIFHLDRTDGIWKLGRYLFGRHPALFPNLYMPAWVIEGLAVYYESRITGTGRLEGSEHYMVAHAAAQEGAFPRLGEISLVTSRFPGGETVYAYGGFIFDYLSRTRGEKTIRDFVELTSSSIFPITLNGKSRRAFGISFERAWKQWTDSLTRTTSRNAEPMAGWRELTHDGWLLSPSRWRDDASLILAAQTPREVPHAYTVTLTGDMTPLGRRNATGVNVILPDGDLLFSQPEFLDPYRQRNDLYIQHGTTQRRLTHDARLSAPDVRRDGAIVAVQNVPGSTRLVRVSANGRLITPITGGPLDEQWFEPRWSPDGARIAAVRRSRGVRQQIVILDTLGTVTFSYGFERAVPASPSWSPDGKRLFFSSDHSGTMQLYSLRLNSSPSAPAERLSNAVTGSFAPEESPDSAWLASILYRTDGYHLGVAPLAREQPAIRDTAILGVRADCATCRIKEALANTPVLMDSGVARPYSPWRSLLPTYWEPVIERASGAGVRIGGATSGTDIIGQHSYFARATYHTKYREGEGLAAYRFSGLGQPYIDISAEQAWDHSSIVNSARAVVGDLAERTHIYSAGATLTRPRVRTFASLSLGGEMEMRRFFTDPDSLLGHLPEFFRESFRSPSVFASASWSNTRRPPLSISREDGFTLSTTARQRWRTGGSSAAPSRSVVGIGTAFRSLDLPGFAHHVIALRAAAGYADERAISAFSAGGLSGTSVDVLAGLSVGDARRNFGIRGFPPGAERGIRAFAGSVEYRAPLAAPSRRIPYIPLLFDRFSGTVFADAARAYCPAAAVGPSSVCSDADVGRPWLASAGAELNLDAALYYDSPLRIRAGFAVPVANRIYGRAKAASFYLTFGSSF